MLICIPFWQNDKQQAIDLCRIIAGLQQHHVGQIAHVLLVNRQDCKPDINMIKIIMTKFNTFTHSSASPMKGWPAGPNGMFASTMIHVSNNAKNKYEVVYWMEPDAIPLCPNWFADLLNEWRKRSPKTLVVGCSDGVHITGCALYHPNISRLMPHIFKTQGAAWDWEHRDSILANGQHTPLIENYYKHTNAHPGILDKVDSGLRVAHGFKDRSLVELVAKKYGIKLD